MDWLYDIIGWITSHLIMFVAMGIVFFLLLMFIASTYSRLRRLFYPHRFKVRIKDGKVSIYGKISESIVVAIADEIQLERFSDFTVDCFFSATGKVEITVKEIAAPLSKKQLDRFMGILKKYNPIEC